MLQNVNTTTETCYRRVTKFTSLQQVTQHNRYIEQGVHSPGKICLVSILIRVTLTNPELQGFHNYLNKSGFFIQGNFVNTSTYIILLFLVFTKSLKQTYL